MDAELVSDKCNEAKLIISEALAENKDLQADFQVWDRAMSDTRIASKLMGRVERLLARFEAVLGKLEVIQDQALTIKRKESKKTGGGSA